MIDLCETYYLVISHPSLGPGHPIPFGRESSVTFKQARLFIDSYLKQKMTFVVRDKDNKEILVAKRGRVTEPKDYQVFWKVGKV